MPITNRDKLAAAWVAANRGRLSKIAESLKVTPQHVHRTLRGKGKSARVLKALKKAGAPVGF